MSNNTDKARYVKLCEGRSKQLTEDIKSSFEDIEKLRTELVSKTVLLESNRNYLKHLQEQFDPKKFVKMYDDLLSNKKISKIVCGAEDIAVFTNVLCCGSNEIGKIIINLNFSKGEIIIQNSTAIVVHNIWGEMHVPQMFFGKVNFGSLNEVINELLVQRDVYNIVLMIVQFIEFGKIDAIVCKSVSFWPNRRETNCQYLKRIENRNFHVRTI